jgi:hypothetical protein
LGDAAHGLDAEGVAQPGELIQARVEVLSGATGHEDSDEDGARTGDGRLRGRGGRVFYTEPPGRWELE